MPRAWDGNPARGIEPAATARSVATGHASIPTHGPAAKPLQRPARNGSDPAVSHAPPACGDTVPRRRRPTWHTSTDWPARRAIVQWFSRRL